VDVDSENESEYIDYKESLQLKKMKSKEYCKVMNEEFGTEDIKMVFVVRNDLNMGKGKIGA
jgi:hypothetical protein